MNQKERLIIAAILFIVAVMVSFDIFTDAKEGANHLHLSTEGFIATLALFGVFYILRGSVKMKYQLEQQTASFTDYKKEAELWKVESKKYIEGLSGAIDQQLSKWKLSAAEKEVAFLLLKGMSLKEVAEIRNTAEKTARVQAIAIYSKSGLSGRSELSAFFLEDLLVPMNDENILDNKS